MRVLIGGEFSGVIRDAFIKKGHDAVSCDYFPSETDGPHYRGNMLDILNAGWDLGIFHPTCTFLTNASVCHLHAPDQYLPVLKGRPRWKALDRSAAFFKTLLECKVSRKCLENPIPHKYAVERIGRKYDQIIHPWQFGHPEKKATCLWLEELPPLIGTNNVRAEMEKLPKREQQRGHYLSPSPDRWKERSRTLQGYADAMAEQWGVGK